MPGNITISLGDERMATFTGSGQYDTLGGVQQLVISDAEKWAGSLTGNTVITNPTPVTPNMEPCCLYNRVFARSHKLKD